MISQGIEIRYIRDRDEQMRIAKACHADPTSGHLGFRKTLARITERFTWKYFQMRHLQLGRDGINLDKFEVIQLSQWIQNDSINCGVYCLKVSKITATKWKCY